MAIPLFFPHPSVKRPLGHINGRRIDTFFDLESLQDHQDVAICEFFLLDTNAASPPCAKIP
jgi:hypothetical protein